MIEKYLIDGTGEGAQFWMDFIGNSIAMHSHSVEGSVHDTTESNLWVRDLADAVWERAKPRHDLTKLDENIITSSLLGMILTLWTCRIRRAKSYDPRRPIDLRQQMLSKATNYNQMLIEAMTDQSKDKDFFPKQDWDDPFAPNAKNGDYV